MIAVLCEDENWRDIGTATEQFIDLVGEDAELLFDRAELITFGSDAVFADLQARADAAEAAQTNRDETGKID